MRPLKQATCLALLLNATAVLAAGPQLRPQNKSDTVGADMRNNVGSVVNDPATTSAASAQRNPARVFPDDKYLPAGENARSEELGGIEASVVGEPERVAPTLRTDQSRGIDGVAGTRRTESRDKK